MASRAVPAGETARDHLAARVPTAQAGASVSDARRALLGATFDVVDALHVLDDAGRLVGRVTLPALLAADGAARVADLATAPPAAVRPGTDQEAVAQVALDHDLPSVPVVEADGRFLGVVPAEALLRVLRREHDEDVRRLAGIRRDDRFAVRALEAPAWRRARNRLPWLLVGLAGSALATFVVTRFEALLAAHVAFSFFVPAIVYLADAIGTQTEAIAVRGLSRAHQPLPRLLLGELRTGSIVGTVLGALAFAAVLLVWRDVRLAVAVSSALVIAGTVATTVGLLLPWWLSRAGRDPAFGSGPLATIVQDVLSILVYFAVVSAVCTP
ncbi:MAG: magnesium transporter [Planctomycetes bacterium]|nr:magnesium transporter [Planctomycetota bacterium]